MVIAAKVGVDAEYQTRGARYRIPDTRNEIPHTRSKTLSHAKPEGTNYHIKL